MVYGPCFAYAKAMCDDFTEADHRDALERARLSRRELGVLGAGALLYGCASGTPAERGDPVGPQGRRVRVPTPDGEAEGYFVAPPSGPAPAVLLWPDVAGLRDAFRTMATRLAAAGYAVLAVNPYYRSSSLPILQTFSEWRTEEGRAKIAPMRAELTPEAVTRDAVAYLDWLALQPEVDGEGKMASIGYCMGGPFALRTAGAAPERIGAFGSFHGGGLVSEDADSPHLQMASIKARALVCIAENDHVRQPSAKPALVEAAKQAGLRAEIEVYPATHGWCVIDSPVYEEKPAERAWQRMLSLFGEALGRDRSAAATSRAGSTWAARRTGR